MPGLPRSVFTTDAFPEKERFAAWREDISVIFDVEASPLQAEGPYRATFDLYHFGQSVIAGLEASTGRYVRSRSKAAKDGLDAILLQLFVKGGVQFGVGQRTTYSRAGDIVVFDLAQPVNNVNTPFSHITTMWPRAEIEQVLPNIARWHGCRLPRKSPAVALLRGHLVSCYRLASRLTFEEARRVESATLSLAGAAMTGGTLLEDAAVNPPMTEMLTYQIKRHIRENLGAYDLSPAQIAQHFGISRTALYQLLEPLGGIARYQLHLRLQRCLADLQSPGQAHRQVSEIAYRWGFNHLATFNRNFRKAFGMTPREARAGALGQIPGEGAVPSVRTKEEQLIREHHQWFQAIGI